METLQSIMFSIIDFNIQTQTLKFDDSHIILH